MRVRMRRRSVSSFVSPGPRVPMPPPSRDSAAPAPTSRGSRYFSCASSTCSLPSRVRARRAKMSRISCVRSMILRPTASSIWRSCAGVSSLSKMTTSTAGFARRRQRASSTLPAPRNVDGIGLRPLLQHAQHDLGAGGLGQAGELVERPLGLEPPRAAGDQADQRGALADALHRACRRHAWISSQAIAPARTSARLARRDVDNRRRRAARRRPGVEQRSTRRRASVRRRPDRRSPARR